jgi:hypothetical protein
MRLISSVLVTALAATTLSTSIAAACGGYVRVDPAPYTLGVTTHGLMEKGKWTQRGFVVLDQKVELDAKAWKRLAPGTYDGTHIAFVAPREQPLELTLLGPSGTRVIKTAKQVALSRSWQISTDQSRLALEIPALKDAQFTIALIGRATDAKWQELPYEQGTAATSWWLDKHGVKDAEYVSVRRISADLDIVEYSKDGTSGFSVRQGDEEVGVGVGVVQGAFTTKGRAFLSVKTQGQLATLELPATARSLSPARRAWSRAASSSASPSTQCLVRCGGTATCRSRRTPR